MCYNWAHIFYLVNFLILALFSSPPCFLPSLFSSLFHSKDITWRTVRQLKDLLLWLRLHLAISNRILTIVGWMSTVFIFLTPEEVWRFVMQACNGNSTLPWGIHIPSVFLLYPWSGLVFMFPRCTTRHKNYLPAVNGEWRVSTWSWVFIKSRIF